MKKSLSTEHFEGLLKALAKDFNDIPLTTLDKLVQYISLLPSVHSDDKENLDPNI